MSKVTVNKVKNWNGKLEKCLQHVTEELILLNIQSASTNQEEKGISKGEN